MDGKGHRGGAPLVARKLLHGDTYDDAHESIDFVISLALLVLAIGLSIALVTRGNAQPSVCIHYSYGQVICPGSE